MTTQVKTQAVVEVYEYMDEEAKPGEAFQPIKIRTHWLRPNMVVLCVGSSKYTVCAEDLRLAIERCSG